MKDPCINCKDQWYAGRNCGCDDDCKKLNIYKEYQELTKNGYIVGMDIDNKEDKDCIIYGKVKNGALVIENIKWL